MPLLMTALWPALLAGIVLGALVGAVAGLPSSRGTRAIAVVLAAAALGLGGLALAGAVAGRPGFWIEASALISASYLAGCLIGGGGKSVLSSKSNAVPAR